MEPAAHGLDEVVELLGRWRGSSGPAARLQIVTEAARVLRDLPSTDSRVLARQLFEHGAPDAAQKMAQQTGGAVSADQLNDAAYALLSVDQRELDGLAGELRDPEQRRRIFEDAGVALRDEVDTDPGAAPPDPTTRQDIPPPPGAPPGTSAAPATSAPATPAPAASAPATPAPAASAPATPAPAASVRAASATASSSQVATPRTSRTDEPPSPEARPASAPRRRTARAARLVDALASATDARQRLRLLDEHALVLGQDELVEVLGAVPDGWQRRTVLRRLLAAGQVRLADDAREVVARFARRGDRFAAAAALIRSRRTDVAPLLTELDPADARRLRRRAAL